MPNPAAPNVSAIDDLLGIQDAFGGLTLNKLQADLQGIDAATGRPDPFLNGTVDVGEITSTNDAFVRGDGYPFVPTPSSKMASAP